MHQMSDKNKHPPGRSASAQGKNRRKTKFAGWLKTLVDGQNSSGRPLTIDDLIDKSGEAGSSAASAHERRILSNILKLRGIRADHLMVPRANIVAINVEASRQELLSVLAEQQFSRLPVYRNTLDDVLGTIHIKDIIGCMARGEEINIRSYIADVPVVSPTMPILDLLLTFQKNSRHIVLVVDEYGGIDGLVTIGDIIEAIVGEVDDEHDNFDAPQIVTHEDGSLVADGLFKIDEFEKLYGALLTNEERDANDTLGGLACSLAGRVPGRGEVLTHSSGMVFEVLDADPRRVNSLRIKNIPLQQG